MPSLSLATPHCLFSFFFILEKRSACVSSLVPPLVFSLPFPLVCVMSSIPMCECHHSHVLSCLPSVCVRQGTCTVCAACHTPTLCPAVLLPLLSSLSVSLPPPSPSFLGASEREKGVWGKGKEEEERCVIQKGMQKGSTNTAKRRRHLVFPPCLQPLSKPRPFTLHFTHHTTSRAFLLVWPSLFLQKHTLVFHINTRGEWFV